MVAERTILKLLALSLCATSIGAPRWLAQQKPEEGQTLSVREIMARNVAARGGAEKLRALQSVAEKYSFETRSGQKGTIVFFSLAPNRIRNETTWEAKGRRDETRVINAYDGSDAWTVTEIKDKKTFRMLNGEEMADLREEARFQFEDPLEDPNANGGSAEFIGMEDVAGTGAYKVRFISPRKRTRYEFF